MSTRNPSRSGWVHPKRFAAGTLVLLLSATPALAASTVTYILELGGNNHFGNCTSETGPDYGCEELDSWEMDVNPPFTPGIDPAGAVVAKDSLGNVTWDIIIDVAGDHEDGSCTPSVDFIGRQFAAGLLERQTHPDR